MRSLEISHSKVSDFLISFLKGVVPFIPFIKNNCGTFKLDYFYLFWLANDIFTMVLLNSKAAYFSDWITMINYKFSKIINFIVNYPFGLWDNIFCLWGGFESNPLLGPNLKIKIEAYTRLMFKNFGDTPAHLTTRKMTYTYGQKLSL